MFWSDGWSLMDGGAWLGWWLLLPCLVVVVWQRWWISALEAALAAGRAERAELRRLVERDALRARLRSGPSEEDLAHVLWRAAVEAEPEPAPVDPQAPPSGEAEEAEEEPAWQGRVAVTSGNRPEGTGEAPGVGAATALLVDDNAINRLVGQRMLEQLGWTVDLAEDGADALEALQDRSYQLVLMDCQMPVLDGVEACRRARDRGETVPIVALTAFSQEEIRQACADAGMDGFLPKPYTLEELAALVEPFGVHGEA